MPIDPQMPDSITMSPQQQATTQGIAQGVANSVGSSTAPEGLAYSANQTPPNFATQHPMVAGVGNVLLSALQGFASGVAGQDAVGQQLRAKYMQDLQDKELANKEKLAKDQVFQQTVQAGIGSQGSAYLANPAIRKRIGMDDLPLYEQQAKFVDQQKQHMKDFAKSVGMPPEVADGLPPDMFKAWLAQQAQALQQKQFQQSQDTTRRGQDMTQQNALVKEQGDNSRAAANLQERYYAVSQANKRAADALTQGGKAGDVIPSVNTSMQKLYKDYDPTVGKYTNQAAIGAAKAHNKMVDAAEAKMKKVDPEANLDEFRVKITGVDKDGNETTTPGRIWGSSPTPVRIVPYIQPSIKQAETGVAAAPHAIVIPEGSKGTGPNGVPTVRKNGKWVVAD